MSEFSINAFCLGFRKSPTIFSWNLSASQTGVEAVLGVFGPVAHDFHGFAPFLSPFFRPMPAEQQLNLLNPVMQFARSC